MALCPAALLCLGLCLGQVWSSQKGPLPKPVLRALPSPLVPLKKPVTLRCQAPPDMDVYRLEKLDTATYRDQDVLYIPTMTMDVAGRYRCSYQNGTHWSPSSDQLELVATGVYDKPVLSALPSATVPRGGDVTLQCQTKHGFDQFALYKEGGSGPLKKPERWYRADFPLVTVRATHSGIYRCYSFSSSSPYLWSAPSNPLKLVVTAGTLSKQPTDSPARTGTPSEQPTDSSAPALALTTAPASAPAPAPELPEIVRARNSSLLNQVSSGGTTRKIPKTPKGPPTAPGLRHQQYSTGNVVRICLGAVTLVLLGGVLLEDWHSRRRVRQAGGAPCRPLPQLPHSPKGPGVDGHRGAPAGAPALGRPQEQG